MLLEQTVTGQTMPLIEGDVRNTAKLIKTLHTNQISAVIHFVGLKAIGESVAKPLDYYANNFQGSIHLLQAMHAFNIKTLVYSSSARVYGDPRYLPIDQAHPNSATNPYWLSKLQVEEILVDVAASDPTSRTSSCATSTL